ncbi:MAG: double-strand break repair protein AddB [Alphaproteobacteria bacterium]|nr:double-strand break repair protein AddB [Alphaproteobacteria bacterium]
MPLPQGLYTIPSGQNFLKKLAEGLWHSVDQDQQQLTKLRVLLPTRRASRGLRDAFLELNNGTPILLPRLQPLGDVNAEELDLTLSGLGLDITDIPPAIPALERQFLLAHQVQRKEQTLPFDQCLALAKNLATLLDQVHTEDLDFSNLESLVEFGEFSEHWKQILTFLEIVTTHWPLILRSRGQVDPAKRRALLMKALTDLWSQHPPESPIIAAGSTGSIPTTASLLNTIANLPRGAVILPGLDLHLEEESWSRIDDTHPQRTMKNLLDKMEKTRTNVKLWPTCTKEDTPRNKMIRAIMLPAQTFGQILPTEKEMEEFQSNITICETINAREQATVIATALRATLEEKGKTACLVTPDRPLARRVTIALKRWNIEADDSAGQALIITPIGTLISSLLRTIEENCAPLAILSLLKHPLCQTSETLSSEEIEFFEKEILRGTKPAPGLEGLQRRIDKKNPDGQEKCQPVIKYLDDHLSPLLELATKPNAPEKFLTELIKQTEIIAGGKELLWSQTESEDFSSLFSNLIIEARKLPPMPFKDWGAIITAILTQESCREIQPRHPRIVILGQLESRLIQHDVMILSGLNEGMWPSEPAHDPWMSRPMRKKFGLPPAARSIGLAAHDFSEALTAQKVIITRSLKEDGAETVPARWLQKLSTLLNAARKKQDWTKTDLIQWSRALDAPLHAYQKPEEPMPTPPLENRPQKLHATWVEKWMNNPYHLYANKILRLKPLPPLEDDTIFADRGTLIHEILKEFIKETEHGIGDNAKNLFLKIAKDKFDELETVSAQWHYWWPRMDKIADWIIAEEKRHRETAFPWQQETEGSTLIYQSPNTGRTFTLAAKADRIDRLKTGGAVIIDYKTGSPPSLKEIQAGLAPQLPLEGIILEDGGFEKTPLSMNGLSYWKVAPRGTVINLHEKDKKYLEYETLLSDARKALNELVRQYEIPTTPYMAIPPKKNQHFPETKAYAHLARISEWATFDEETETNEEGGQQT